MTIIKNYRPTIVCPESADSLRIFSRQDVATVSITVFCCSAPGTDLEISAAIASGEANCVLIPEVPFALDGPNGLLEYIYKRVVKRGHAVVIVAEGAGQDMTVNDGGADASGSTARSAPVRSE